MFGLIYGIMFVLMGAAFGLSRGMRGVEAFGLLSIIMFLIIFAICGFTGGAITALLYNFFAEKMGGIQVNLVQK